jgi:hypothetical protein
MCMQKVFKWILDLINNDHNNDDMNLFYVIVSFARWLFTLFVVLLLTVAIPMKEEFLLTALIALFLAISTLLCV